ncbi:hypothetical protein PYCCODRAFT_1471324 [Trametes coccinea BRFM310]|uniref:F-box domain-containing protein n=1 Tax=Trametes coccinea (strain BRFM310) TaxID=1353009 RepID=A0A1Y2IAF4_TRAC3|nr:hypothetical protein PYCCODRAFT_1471324 [Trametes coccinea BRFM310]
MPPKKKSRTTRSAKNVQASQDSKGRQSTSGAVTRPTGRVLRGRRGSLKDLPEMPTDILNEIFSYLHPTDLLSLVRTNKAFCRFLLDPRNVRMWRVCREGAQDIPPLPPFLSETAFAHLLFAPFCHGCGKSPVHKVMWIWFTRYCRQCLEEKRGYIRSYPPFLEGVPDREILVKGKGQFSEILSLINPSDGNYCYQRHNNYHIPQLERFLAEWNAAESSEARKGLYEKQKALIVEMRKHERVLEKWWERRQEDRSDELNAVRRQRFSEICKRLEDAGWGQELARLRGTSEGKAALRSVHTLYQPTKLTDKAFETVLRQMEGLLTDTRNTLEQEKRRAKLVKRVKVFEQAVEAHYVQVPRNPRMLCRPRFGDLIFEPEVEALFTGPNADGLTVADFAPIIPTLGSRWEERIKEKLRAMVKAQVEGIPDDKDPLDLAVALFACPGCHVDRSLRYPDILAHYCLRYHHLVPKTPYGQDIKAATSKMGSSCIRFSVHGVQDTLIVDGKQFLTVLGMSPATTTWDELAKENVLFRRKQCRCYSGDDHCGAYTWDAALHKSRRKKEYDAWRPVTPQELEAISILGVPLRPTIHNMGYRTDWHCGLCINWSGNGDNVEKHLKEKHQLENVKQCVEDGTVFMHPCEITERRPIPLPHVAEIQ